MAQINMINAWEVMAILNGATVADNALEMIQSSGESGKEGRTVTEL